MSAQTLGQRQVLGAAGAVTIRWADLVALTKPGITRMIVLTTAVGLWLAPGAAGLKTWVFTLLGTALVVSAANTLNCYLERDVDGRMSRTRDRPLPAGRLEGEVALALGLMLAVLSVPVLALGVGPLPGFLSLLALVSYVAVYTPLKRVSTLSTLAGAVPGALPALIGWTAATGRIDAPGLVLFGIVFFWQMPHFLAIGLFRLEEYAAAGFRILPVARGVPVTRRAMVLWTLPLVPVSLLLVPLGVVGWVYAVLALILGGAFLATVARGLGRDVPEGWARQAFGLSLLYLSGLYAALALDAMLL